MGNWLRPLARQAAGPAHMQRIRFGAACAVSALAAPRRRLLQLLQHQHIGRPGPRSFLRQLHDLHKPQRSNTYLCNYILSCLRQHQHTGRSGPCGVPQVHDLWRLTKLNMISC